MLLALLLLAGLCAAQPDNLHKDFNQLYPYSPFFYPFNPYFYPFYTPYYSHPNLLHQAKDDFKDIKPGYKVPEGKEGHVLPPFVYAPFPLEKTFYQAAPQSKQDFQPEFKAPEFKLPEFKAPEYKVPEYKAPEVPEFQVPEYKVPDFQAPKFKEVPDFEPPQFKEVPYHEDPQEVHIAPPAEPKDTQIVHKEEPAYQTFMFIGKYEGTCKGHKDGLYYVDKKTFAYCVDNRDVFQPCSEGTENPGLEEFMKGQLQYSHHFCSVNLLAQNTEPVPTHADPHYDVFYYDEKY